MDESRRAWTLPVRTASLIWAGSFAPCSVRLTTRPYVELIPATSLMAAVPKCVSSVLVLA